MTDGLVAAGPDEAATARWLAPALAAGAVITGLIAGALVAGGNAAAVPALALLILPVVLWRRPQLGPVILLAAATTIEQFPYKVGPRNGAATDRIPLFAGLDPSLHVNPADLLLLLLTVVWVVKGAGTARWPRSPVSTAVAALMGTVALGLAVGLAHHGDLRVSFTEVRPYAYLSASFLLATVLLTTRTAVRSMLWALVVGPAFKAAQGLVLFASSRHLQPRPEAVLGHEEAFFFGVFLVLVLGLWLFEIRGPLRATATMLTPLVFFADLVNSRRTAFLILAVSALTLAVIGLVALPHRRLSLWRALAATAAVSAVYFPAYWHHSGSLAQPARAVRAITSPEQRDAASDLYRTQENANLRLNIRQSRLIGKGFGVPIDYALPIVDIKSIDPLITYIPHNGVLYVVMRMGVLGGIAFWSLVGLGIMTSCRMARSRDRELALIGALVACVLVAYVFEGYNDQGFFFYRIAIAVGSMLGVGQAALLLDRGTNTAASRAADGPWSARRRPPVALVLPSRD